MFSCKVQGRALNTYLLNDYVKGRRKKKNVNSLRTVGRYCQVGTMAHTSPELWMVPTALLLVKHGVRAHTHTQPQIKQNQREKAVEF